MPNKPQPGSSLRDLILDLNQTPVARMRLFSEGVNKNTRLFFYETAVGDRACLACGNCVDACPVVRDKQRFVFIQNQRTSMALENIVGLECRRCYNCIQACPQVTKENKDYANSYRRGEKAVHLLLACTIFLLAATGIITSHYRNFLPLFEVSLLDVVHRALGMVLIFLPVLYYMIDRHHFFRLFRKIFSWNRNDLKWVKELIEHLRDHRKNPMPYTGEFNTAQKAWYLYVVCMLPLMAVTGMLMALEFYDTTEPAYFNLLLIHMVVALITDLLLFVHIYIKYLRKWAITVYDLVRVFIKRHHLNYADLYEKGDYAFARYFTLEKRPF
ncbi:MAG: cytochrome b/b6 domain-containing protein [Deltaproteobacteria bacterium]|nr:cytochrome b/b6 domain-containing protein [Deltaproteobacteria bacterium]MBW2150514.1 cytochrome b/b6 domain-containing protein [Deltaproteobacteria bacterium]